MLTEHKAELELALACPHLVGIAQRDHTSDLNRQVSMRAFRTLVNPSVAEFMKATMFKGLNPAEHTDLLQTMSDEDLMSLCNTSIRLALVTIHSDENPPPHIYGSLMQMLHLRTTLIALIDED